MQFYKNKKRSPDQNMLHITIDNLKTCMSIHSDKPYQMTKTTMNIPKQQQYQIDKVHVISAK